MADDDRTEHPTARRLQKAIEEGQIARSVDLSAAAVTIGAMAMIMYLGHGLFTRMTDLFAKGFEFDRKSLDRPQLLIGMWSDQLLNGLWVVLPVVLVTLLAAILVNVGMSGLHFSMKAFTPNFAKLNPLKGLVRIFGKQAWVELGKSILKFIVVACILWLSLSHFLKELLLLGLMDLEPAMQSSGAMLTRVGLWVALGLVLIALIDVPYQKYTHLKGLKMTKQEVKDEMKNFIKNNQKTTFSDAASTAAKQVTNGSVIGGHVGIEQGFLVYTFFVVDTESNTSYVVTVDAGNGSVLYKSEGKQMGDGFGPGFFGHGGFGHERFSNANMWHSHGFGKKNDESFTRRN